jgi:hypothetical protein
MWSPLLRLLKSQAKAPDDYQARGRRGRNNVHLGLPYEACLSGFSVTDFAAPFEEHGSG